MTGSYKDGTGDGKSGWEVQKDSCQQDLVDGSLILHLPIKKCKVELTIREAT